MDDGGSHIVVAMRRTMRVLMLPESDGVDIAAAVEAHERSEFMRLRDSIDRFEKTAPVDQSKQLARALRTYGLDGDLVRPGRKALLRRQPKARRNAFLENLEPQSTILGLDPVSIIVATVRVGGMIVSVRVTVPSSAEQKDARDIDRQPQECNRNCLVEADRNRPDAD
jgi:hypothetical protein